MAVVDRIDAMEGSEPHLAGELFGRYEILFPIASGGMATVYAARLVGDAGFQKPIAIKLMLPHLTQDERFVAMFLDEATLAANVESSNVVGVRDLGREGDTLYMAMDLVIGANLQELLRAGALPPAMAASVIVQTARGLHDAHQATSPTGEPLELVHRDVSPHNVLIGVDGRVRLSDFGVARAMHRRTHTQTGELKGKLAYFSPEQLEARDQLDRRSDVFALGVVAWEAFRGQRLFAAPNPLALAKLIASHPIPRLDEEMGLPTAIADVVARALERDVARRFRTAEDMANALERAARASVGWATPAGLGELVRVRGGARVQELESRIRRLMSGVSGPQPTATPYEPVEVTEAPAKTRRVSRWLATGGFVVVAVGVGVGLGLRSSESESLEVDPVTMGVAPSAAGQSPITTTEVDSVVAEPVVVEPVVVEPAVPVAEPVAEATPEASDVAIANEAEDGARATPRRSRRLRRPRATPSDVATSREPTPAPRAPEATTPTDRSSRAILRVDLERFERSLQNGE
ncbi:MAG: serine/threonine protein kinase [Sandaracinus sp.]|nr:serine/threonine protein kinase [Sandaracinus sp.]MCB9622746.1 serine/threonine protein kinase [Sandaracinus sp.]MCB9636134.1 serine/threonine protein kinase [Sandaracinus sp.]